MLSETKRGAVLWDNASLVQECRPPHAICTAPGRLFGGARAQGEQPQKKGGKKRVGWAISAAGASWWWRRAIWGNEKTQWPGNRDIQSTIRKDALVPRLRLLRQEQQLCSGPASQRALGCQGIGRIPRARSAFDTAGLRSSLQERGAVARRSRWSWRQRVPSFTTAKRPGPPYLHNTSLTKR